MPLFSFSRPLSPVFPASLTGSTPLIALIALPPWLIVREHQARQTHRAPLVTLAALAGAIVALAALPAAVKAQTLATADRGWYDATGSHMANNKNIAIGLFSQLEYRNFFVFNIPTLTAGQIYTSAVLQLQLTPASMSLSQAGYYQSVDATENYVLNDVTTSLTSLSAGTGGTAAFNDLGSGTTYGSRTFSAADNNTLVSITLNASALSALNAASGSQFGIGGYVSTISGTGNQIIFNFSDAATTSGSSLVLTSGASGSAAAPEPSTLAFLLPAMGSAASVGFVRRRRRHH